MKKTAIFVLAVVVLAGAPFAAYRLGLLDRLVGTVVSDAPAPATATGSPAAGGAVPGSAVPGAATAPGSPGGVAPAAVPPQAPDAPATAAAVPAAAAPTASVPPVAVPTAPATPLESVAQAAAPGLVAVAPPGQPVSNKAVELRVTGVSTAPGIANLKPGAGREFVVVNMSWKSLVPPQKVNRKKMQDRTAGMGGLGFGGGATAKDRAEDAANTTLEDVPFEIGPLTQKVWLVANGAAEGIDVAATNATAAHLPPQTLRLPAQNAVKEGPLVFQAASEAASLAVLVLDAVNGHLLVPIRGAAPVPTASLGGTASRSNELVDLAVTGTSWADAAAQVPGTKTLFVGLRGISRQPAIAQIPFGSFAFLQTSQGCIAQPEGRAPQLERSLAPMGAFLPFVPSEGQLAFTVPADTPSATLLIRLRQGGPIDLPALGDGTATKPATRTAHDDGQVLRVSIVGANVVPSALVRPRPGFEPLVVDYIVENLKSGTGLELQPGPQFALADPQGVKYPPDRASQQLPCRLSGANVVPAGGWRRFSLLYLVPEGQPMTLQYRGFESSGHLKVR